METTTQETEEQREKREYREALVEIVNRLHELNYRWNAQRLLAALDAILIDEGGCITPAESFVLDLLGTYHFHHGLTPDDVEQNLEEFRENFTDAVKVARYMAERYPREFKGETEPAGQ